MASNFVLSSLTTYVDQKLPLVRKSLFGGQTAKVANKQTGIKSAEAINILDNTIVFGSGSVCTFTAAGNTTFTQRNITVGSVSIHKEYCQKDLDPYWTQQYLKKGNEAYSELNFADYILELISAGVERQLEISLWTGDTSVSTANTNKFDGLMKIIDACSGSATVLPTGSAGTKSGSALLTYLDSAYTTASADISYEPDVYIFTGLDIYKNFLVALKNSNNYHHDAVDQLNYEYNYFGNYTVKGVPGLNDTNRIYLMRGSNIYVGIDGESDQERFEVWYSPDNRSMRVALDFKYGVQVAFCDQIVLGRVQ